MPPEGVGDWGYRHRLSFGRTPSGFCPSWPFCLTRFNFLRLVFIGRWERRWRVTKPSVNPGFSLEFVPCFGICQRPLASGYRISAVSKPFGLSELAAVLPFSI